jgi:hypothetical protein
MNKERKSRYRHGAKSGYLSWRIEKQMIELAGRDKEKTALEIARGPLKEKFKRLKYQIEPCYGGIYKQRPRGKDLEFTIIAPFILKVLLKNQKIYLEIKGSKKEAKKHKERGKTDLIYQTPVVIIKKKEISPITARPMFDVLRTEIREKAYEKIEKKLFFRFFPNKRY